MLTLADELGNTLTDEAGNWLLASEGVQDITVTATPVSQGVAVNSTDPQIYGFDHYRLTRAGLTVDPATLPYLDPVNGAVAYTVQQIDAGRNLLGEGTGSIIGLSSATNGGDRLLTLGLIG